MAGRDPEDAFDTTEWWKWVEIRRTRWKGKKAREESITQNLHANVNGEAEYCSVAAVSFLLAYYDLNKISDGPLFRKFESKKGKRVPRHSNFERKLGNNVSKWYKEREEKRDSEGNIETDVDGNQSYKWKKPVGLTEAEARDMLMRFFKEAARIARLDVTKSESSLAAQRLEAATPHTFRASELVNDVSPHSIDKYDCPDYISSLYQVWCRGQPGQEVRTLSTRRD